MAKNKEEKYKEASKGKRYIIERKKEKENVRGKNILIMKNNTKRMV